MNEEIKSILAALVDKIENTVEEINKGDIDLLKLANDVRTDIDNSGLEIDSVIYFMLKKDL